MAGRKKGAYAKLQNWEEKNYFLALANADYEESKAKDRGHSVNIRMFEKRWKLKAGQLVNYRAMKNRRKHGIVRAIHKGGNYASNASE